MTKQKLELTWIGKENRPKLEPRILLEDSELSYHAKRRVASADFRAASHGFSSEFLTNVSRRIDDVSGINLPAPAN